jgi:hypothetical protein
MKNNDLASFKIDCSIAEQQLNYLRDMRPTIYERRDAEYQKTMFGAFSPNYDKNKDIVFGKVDYLIDVNIKEIYYTCYR